MDFLKIFNKRKTGETRRVNIMNILHTLVLILYSVTTIIYVCYFINQSPKTAFAAKIALGLSILVHGLYLGMFIRIAQRLPLTSLFEVLTVLTFIFAIIYFALELNIHDASMGIIISPLLIIFQGIASTGLEPAKSVSPILNNLPFHGHVLLMIIAYASFTIAFIASLFHVLLDKEIRLKKLGFFFSRLPSLELLDKMNLTAVALGFLFATAGMLWGFLMALHVWQVTFPLDAKFISFVLIWAIYLFLLIARIRLGWQGKRSAWVSIVGFAFILFSFLIISVYFTQKHLYL